MTDETTDKRSALVVYTDGGHVFSEDIRLRTSEEVEAVRQMIRELAAGELDAESLGFKVDERDIHIRFSKIVALTLASED